MTKTLTEQWRNEELPIDLYYVIDKLGRETIGNDCGIRDMMVDAFNGGNIFIKEVLAPVPSYEEYKHLQEQLKEANEALKCIRYQVKIGEFPCDACGYSMKCEGCWCGDLAKEYLKKWGVK